MEILNTIIQNDVFILAILVMAVGLAHKGYKYLKQKDLINEEGLTFIINGVQIGEKTLRDMGILKDDNSKVVTRLLLDTLSYMKTLETSHQDDLVLTAYQYFFTMAQDLDVDIDPQTEQLIRDLFKKVLIKK